MELINLDLLFIRSITSFYLENLPPGISELFIPQQPVPMPLEALPAFAAQLDIPGAERSSESMKAMDEFFKIFSNVVEGNNPGGSFFRLGSRSPKDTFNYRPLKVLNPLDAIHLCMLSDRIGHDIHWGFLHSYSPTFFVRPWLEMERWREFRCFVKDGKLYGISQYYCFNDAEFPEIAVHSHIVAKLLAKMILESVIPAAPHHTFACDVYYLPDVPKLIDYNPFNHKTGMCLFDASYQSSHKTELRFRHNGNVAALPLPQEKIA